MSAYDQDLVSEQNAEDTARLFEIVLARVGELGREAREAIKARLDDLTEDDDIVEGIAQMEELFGGD